MRPRETTDTGADTGRRDPSPRHGLLEALHERLRREAYAVPSEDVAASIIDRALERRACERRD